MLDPDELLIRQDDIPALRAGSENAGCSLSFGMFILGIGLTVLVPAVIILRSAILLIGALIWCLAFAPSRGLNAIARRTGAESYFDVGKYIVLVVLTAIGIWQSLGIVR